MKNKIPSVNDLLEQPLQNETSKDEIMHDQVGQKEFENSDEDQIVQDEPNYSSVQDRSRPPPEKEIRERDKESKVIPKIKQSLEVQDLLGV